MASKLVPKKFLCKYELKIGANVYGALMCLVMLACIIAGLVDMLASKDACEEAKSVKRRAYAFSILIIIYSVLMLAVHLWFLWAVKRNKVSVVLVWVAMTGLWLTQTTILTIILLCLYIPDACFLTWLMCLIFGIIAFVICVYGLLIGYGFWLEMKGRQREQAPTA